MLSSRPRNFSVTESRSVESEVFLSWTQVVRLRLPAQTVDATPSNQYFRSYFSEKTDLLGCTQSDLIRTGFSLNRRPRADLAS
jgi:hypothetical protein